MTLTTSAYDRPPGRPGHRSQRSPEKPTSTRDSNSTERPRPDQVSDLGFPRDTRRVLELLTARCSSFPHFLPELCGSCAGTYWLSARRRACHRHGRVWTRRLLESYFPAVLLCGQCPHFLETVMLEVVSSPPSIIPDPGVTPEAKRVQSPNVRPCESVVGVEGDLETPFSLSRLD
ncbi:hypothetical protein LEMLEM_LOCUS16417 [Lemmus lemmus]